MNDPSRENLARCLKDALPLLMEQCQVEGAGERAFSNVSRVLSALVGIATGSGFSFWEELVTDRSSFAALGEALDRIERSVDLLLPLCPEAERPELRSAFGEITSTFRADLMRLFQSSDAGVFLDPYVTEHLPLPMYLLADWRLTPLNQAARVQLVTGRSDRCHRVFFDLDSACPGCPLEACLTRNQPSECPEVAGRRGLSMRAYKARAVLSFPRSSSSFPEMTQQVNALASSLLDHLGTGVVFASSSGRIAYANSSAREVLKMDPVGLLLGDVLPGAEEPEDVQKRLKHQAGGSTIIVGYRSQRCIFEQEVGIIVTFRDIADVISKQQIRRLSEIGRMTATVAHEVRNPLAGIIATIQSVEPEMRAAHLGEVFEVVQGEAQRLTELLDSFFTFVRDKPARRQWVDLKELVMGSRRSLGIRAKGVELDAVPAARVFVDPAQIKQVLINLLANALDAIPQTGGQVAVRAEVEDGALRLWVRDNGTGMQPDVMGNAFEPFFSTKHTGTGLGLAICYQLVTAHGGTIYLESRPDAGTTVEITLPAACPSV